MPETPPFVRVLVTPSSISNAVPASRAQVVATAEYQRWKAGEPARQAAVDAAMEAAREQEKHNRNFHAPQLPVSGSHTIGQLQAMYGYEKGAQMYEAEHAYYREHPSSGYLSQVAAYNVSSNRVVNASGGSSTVWQGEARLQRWQNPYAEDSAAGIAWEVGRLGETINRYLANTATSEGYSGPMNVSWYSGRTSDFVSDITRFAQNQFSAATATFSLANRYLSDRQVVSPQARQAADVLQEQGRGLLTAAFDTILGGFRQTGRAATTNVLTPSFVEENYYAAGGRAQDVGLSAKFLGKDLTPAFSPIPGSVTERFAFDEYGKVLRGGPFEPATSAEGIPYNSKMGSGSYKYVGEYQYGTGERVSRYVEENVGSYVDFGQGGMAFRKDVVIRGGAGPGGFYETYGQKTVARSATPIYSAQQSAVLLQTATMGPSASNLFGYAASPEAAMATGRAGAYANRPAVAEARADNIWGQALKGMGILGGTTFERAVVDFSLFPERALGAAAGTVSAANAMFAKVPVLAEMNLAGRDVSLGMEASGIASRMQERMTQYEKEGIISEVGGERVFAGTQDQYADLQSMERQLASIQGQQEAIHKQLV